MNDIKEELDQAEKTLSQSQLLTTASQSARSLFTSTSYETSPYRSDSQYVTDLYYAYLERGPDDSGLNWWAGQVPNGRVNVCNAFEASGEFQTLVATLYGTSTSDNQRTEQFVNNFYLGAYGRNATATELQQQRDAMNAAAAQGQASVQTQAETMGRALFAAQVNDASLSNTQYVTNLYEAFLQRGPDAGGLSWWSGQASVGQGRQNVLNAFATCGAFRELAGTLYREANWLVADQLGTPRMMVNRSGSLASVKRHDYLPFGEELYVGTGGRTWGQGYTGDSVRQKFTGYERDAESGLDYAHARYYANAQGRFSSPDPFFGSIGNPQTLNRYAYVRNNPTNLVDPSGLITSGLTHRLVAPQCEAASARPVILPTRPKAATPDDCRIHTTALPPEMPCRRVTTHAWPQSSMAIQTLA
jgi:RHS repeat-associated protein